MASGAHIIGQERQDKRVLISTLPDEYMWRSCRACGGTDQLTGTGNCKSCTNKDCASCHGEGCFNDGERPKLDG